jgi:hypothetical protein
MLIYKGARGMGESSHDQERVGRPRLALPRPMLSEERRVQLRQELAALTVLIVGPRCGRSVTCMHALLRSLTLMDMGGRGMGELDHDQERVGRPRLALPRPMLSEYRWQHCRQDLAALTVLIVGPRCGLSRACTRFYGVSRSWTWAAEAWASWTMIRSEWDDQGSCDSPLGLRGVPPR